MNRVIFLYWNRLLNFDQSSKLSSFVNQYQFIFKRLNNRTMISTHRYFPNPYIPLISSSYRKFLLVCLKIDHKELFLIRIWQLLKHHVVLLRSLIFDQRILQIKIKRQSFFANIAFKVLPIIIDRRLWDFHHSFWVHPLLQTSQMDV